MAIYHYTENNPHPAGFIGLRVARSVAGEYRQRYFATAGLSWSEIDARIREAVVLDARWLRDAEILRAARARDAAPTVRCQTSPVRGIRAVVVRDVKRRATTRVYETRAWEVSIAESNPKRFRIPQHGDRGAFERAVQYLCRMKGWDRRTCRRLMARWRPHASYQEHTEAA